METPTFASRMNGHRRLAQSTCLAALLVAALALPGALTGQAATVTTTGSGNWSNTTPDAPWPGGAVPAPGSDIVINNGYTVTVTANVTNSPATITISAGSQLSVGGFNLTSGATTVYGTLLHTSAAGAHSFIGDVTIASGGIWNETAAAIISYGGNLQNDGTLTASTGMHTFTGTNKTFSGANEIAISNLTVTGSYQNNGALTVATLLTVTSPGVVTNNGTITATASLAGTGALTQGAGATLNLSGTSAITTLNAAASPNTVNFSGAAQTVNVVTYNSLILSGSGAKPLTSISTINSNLTLSGTATAATAVNLSIGGNLSVGTGSTFTVAGITLTVTGDTTVSGQLAHNNTTGLKTFSGNVTINSGGFWNETAAAQISIGGNLQIDGTNVASTGIHTFTGSGKTLSGARGIVIPNVTINGTYQNNATQTVETALAGTGTLTQGPGATLNLGGPANTAITITNLNALSNINSVKYTNALQTVKPTPYYYLILSGNGAKTMTGVTNISADLTISGSATITSNAALTIGGALNYLSSGSSTLTNNLSGNALTITNGTLDLGAGLTHIFTGTWTRAAGTLMGGSSTLKIGGSVSGAGGAFTAGTSTVEWNAAGDQTLAAVTYNKLILSGSGAKAIGAGTAVAGNLNIATSARASVGNGLNIGVGSLTFDGAGQANGTWGSSSAPYATRQNDVFFSPTTGYLAVNADLRPTTVTWRGTGDWFRAVGTWSNGVPGPGSNVWIASGSVTLTNATPQLGEFAIGEATLVFTNWNTYLTASNVAVLSNGVMTLPPAFTTNAGLSNRVWVVCTNLTINAGGQINTDYKGYAGGPASANGYGPGAGLASAGGAGHGGRGGTIGSAFGANPFADSGGGAYDSASAPNQPGSGGAGQANAGAGGSGGGVIRIQASGTVTVNGSITARGQNGTPYSGNMYSGCGAGGAIWINCLTLAGNNGVINADGGTGAGFALQAAGGGGGGRIAMLYGSLSGTPNVQLSAAAGLGAYVFYTSLAGFESAMGSVYLPDTNLLSSTINNLAGRLVISNTAAWTTPNLTVTNTMLGFDDNFALNVTGDLVVGGSNTVLLTGSNSQTTVGGAVRLQNAGQLQLQGNLTAGGSVSLESGTNILAARGNLLVNCGGNFTVTNGGAVYLMSGKTNGLGRSYGLLMSVTGDVNIAAASWVYPYSHYSDGGSCRLTMNNLTIPPNAGFNADSKGFNGVWNGSGYGPGAGTYTGGGAGYGGKGGNTSLGGAAGNPYGSTNAPIQPGSGGGAHPNATAPSPGGGEVWIEAAGNVQLDGTITANGQSGYYMPTDMRSGCGSGGGIFILCSGLSGGASGVLSANGGSGTNFTGRSGGGGGGGRISVGIGFSADNKAKLLAGTSITGLIAYAQEPVFTGTLSVTSGIGYTNLPPGGAASGSKQFMRILGASDCALTITGDPAQYGAPDTNGYATWVTAPGTVFTNTVISPASELNGQRWSCIGWRVNTNAGGLIASGTTTQAVFTVSTNVTLTWLWTNQYQLAVSAAGTYGSVNSGVVNGFYTNGTVVTGIQATPTNAGAYFVAWVGASVPAGQATANPLSVTMDRVRTNLTATFSLTAGEPKTWTGVGNWTSYTNWSPQGMPGSNDNAVLQSGTSTISEAYSIGSLVVSNGAALIFTNWSTCLTASNVTIRNQGLMTLPASFGTNEMSNRVYVLAHNFTVDTGGIVNADSKGYKTGQGPGKGISNGSNLNTGGGHGGKGGRNSSCSGGETNDVPEAPVFPGSGGGDYTDDGDTGMGGGAVRIAATNVVVNGTISADGASGGTYDGGGAGGSIFITCATLGGGTSGVLQARGGYGGSGYPADTSGGGGRIAVIYSTLSGNAGVHFSAAAGSKNTYPGGMGTLYLPNTNLVQQPFNNFQGVRLVINGFNSWNSDSLLVSNSVVSFGDGDFTLSVTNNLTVWSNSWLALGGVALSGTQSLQAVTATATNPVVNVGGNLYLTGGGLTLGGAGQLSHIAMNIGSNVIATGGGILRLGGAAQILTATINVASNLTLNRGILQLGGLASFSNNTLNVGGDLILTNGAELWIYSGPSNTSVNSYGASVSITGMTYITSNSWIYPYAHPTNGGAPYFQLSKDLIISSNAGFNANGAGYQAGYGPGKGVSDSSTSCSGGGYGGRGGNSSTKNGGISNGVAHAPVGPGSGGGYYDALGYGGGAIRIDAKRITLGGVLTANGNVTTYNGGGSGGSIFLVCDSFLGGNSAFLCATGGPQANTALKSGGGGGGRIAVWVGLSETQKAQVWAGNLSRLTVAGTNQYFTGAFSVTNGLDYTNPPTGGAAVGTIVFITSPPVRGTMIMMR